VHLPKYSELEIRTHLQKKTNKFFIFIYLFIYFFQQILVRFVFDIIRLALLKCEYFDELRLELCLKNILKDSTKQNILAENLHKRYLSSVLLI